jgi:hypothetical protein
MPEQSGPLVNRAGEGVSGAFYSVVRITYYKPKLRQKLGLACKLCPSAVIEKKRELEG